MDVSIELTGMRFSWLDTKLKLNERNHDGVSLKKLRMPFSIPMRFTRLPAKGIPMGDKL